MKNFSINLRSCRVTSLDVLFCVRSLLRVSLQGALRGILHRLLCHSRLTDTALHIVFYLVVFAYSVNSICSLLMSAYILQTSLNAIPYFPTYLPFVAIKQNTLPFVLNIGTANALSYSIPFVSQYCANCSAARFLSCSVRMLLYLLGKRFALCYLLPTLSARISLQTACLVSLCCTTFASTCRMHIRRTHVARIPVSAFYSFELQL